MCQWIRTLKVEAFMEYSYVVDGNINFTCEDVRGTTQALLDCAVHIEEDSLNIKIYRIPTHIDQYLLFNSNHPL